MKNLVVFCCILICCSLFIALPVIGDDKTSNDYTSHPRGIPLIVVDMTNTIPSIELFIYNGLRQNKGNIINTDTIYIHPEKPAILRVMVKPDRTNPHPPCPNVALNISANGRIVAGDFPNIACDNVVENVKFKRKDSCDQYTYTICPISQNGFISVTVNSGEKNIEFKLQSAEKWSFENATQLYIVYSNNSITPAIAVPTVTFGNNSNFGIDNVLGISGDGNGKQVSLGQALTYRITLGSVYKYSRFYGIPAMLTLSWGLQGFSMDTQEYRNKTFYGLGIIVPTK